MRASGALPWLDFITSVDRPPNGSGSGVRGGPRRPLGPLFARNGAKKGPRTGSWGSISALFGEIGLFSGELAKRGPRDPSGSRSWVTCLGGPPRPLGDQVSEGPPGLTFPETVESGGFRKGSCGTTLLRLCLRLQTVNRCCELSVMSSTVRRVAGRSSLSLKRSLTHAYTCSHVFCYANNSSSRNGLRDFQRRRGQ